MEIYDNFKNYICLTVKMVFQVYLTLFDYCTIINSKFESLKFLTASKNIKKFTSN